MAEPKGVRRTKLDEGTCFVTAFRPHGSRSRDEVNRVVDEVIENARSAKRVKHLSLDDIIRRNRITFHAAALREHNHDFLQSGVTYDDVLLYPHQSLPSRFGRSVGSDADSGPDTHTHLVRDIDLDLPIASSNMDTVTGYKMAILLAQLGGIGFLPRGTISFDQQLADVRAVKQAAERDGTKYLIGASLGVNGKGREKLSRIERAKSLIAAGIDVLLFDIANAQNPKMYDAVKEFKDAYPDFPLIAGNVATVEGAYALIKAGADCIKVGIGPGGACTTRVHTGHGVPQLTAVYVCNLVAEEFGKSIIADGGIKESGDIVKALAAGANAVMLGTLLAGTDEAPGEIIEKDGRKYKTFRGMASAAVQRELGKKEEHIIAEGVSELVLYKGPAEKILRDLRGGVWSGMSYSDARTLGELRAHAVFQKVTPMTHVEGLPRLQFYR